MDTDGVRNGRRQLLSDLSTRDAEALLAQARPAARPTCASTCPRDPRVRQRRQARRTCISRHHDGALLLELFTRDGVGTMVAANALAHMRNATIDDVGGILAIIEPLEEQGVLVRRSRERLEAEIERFVVAEHDDAHHRLRGALCVSRGAHRRARGAGRAPDFRREGYGEALLHEIEQRARKLKLTSLFVLTTQDGALVPRARLSRRPRSPTCPQQKQALYNYQRQVAGLPKSRCERSR